MKIDASTFALRAPNVPSLPSICHELTEAIQDPDSSVSDISRIVGSDPSLAGRLLKLANSVFYGFPARIGTLEHAVQLIGLKEVRDLVLATSVIDAFDQLPDCPIDGPAFWKHSIACGLASALLAREKNHPEPERLFVGGLLHDIGRLVMLRGAPEQTRQVLARCNAEEKLCSRVETEVFGFDHAVLGGELLALWNLPRSIVQMVRCHHNPPRSSGALADIFTVHYADFLTNALEFGDSGEFLVAPLVVPPTLTGAILAEDRIEAFVDDLEDQCERIFPILGSNPSPVNPTSATAEPEPAAELIVVAA